MDVAVVVISVVGSLGILIAYFYGKKLGWENGYHQGYGDGHKDGMQAQRDLHDIKKETH